MKTTTLETSRMEAISIAESRELDECERDIAEGKQSMEKAGKALLRIRDKRLYRNNFKTFEAYCRHRWKWQRSWSYRLISFAEVKMSPLATKVSNEAQARELKSIPAEKQPEVLTSAQALAKSESRPMTAKDIRQAARPFELPFPAVPSSTSPKAARAESVAVQKDGLSTAQVKIRKLRKRELPGQSDSESRSGTGTLGIAHPAPPINGATRPIPKPTKPKASEPDRAAFATALESLGNECVAVGTLNQLCAFKLACEVWVKKLAAAIRAKQQEAIVA